jgi:hypothetical protein
MLLFIIFCEYYNLIECYLKNKGNIFNFKESLSPVKYLILVKVGLFINKMISFCSLILIKKIKVVIKTDIMAIKKIEVIF